MTQVFKKHSDKHVFVFAPDCLIKSNQPETTFTL